MTHKCRRVVLPVGGVPCTGGRLRSGFYIGKKPLKSNAGHLGPKLRPFYLLCKPRGDKIHGVSYSSAPVPWATALRTLRRAATRAAVGLPRAWAPWGSWARCLPTQAPRACRHTYACCYNWLWTKWAPGHFSPRPNQQHCPFLLPRNAVPHCNVRRSSPVLNVDKFLGHLTLPQACCKCQWLLLLGVFISFNYVCIIWLFPNAEQKYLLTTSAFALAYAVSFFHIQQQIGTKLDFLWLLRKPWFADHRSSCCSSVSLSSSLPFSILIFFMCETISFEYPEKCSHAVPNSKHFLLFFFFLPNDLAQDSFLLC